MLDLRQILCPIDFSEPSRHALAHAAALAHWHEATLTALHVRHQTMMPQPPVLFAEPGTLDAEDEHVERDLNVWLNGARQAGVRTATVCERGDPVTRILACAESLPADLVVLGTYGFSGFQRFMLGSITESLLHKCPRPVLTVPPTSLTPPKATYTRIVCAVDFSPSSLAAARVAFSLAEEADARLTLLHVLDWPPDDEYLVEQFEPNEFRKLVERRARGRLEALVTDEAQTWCKPAMATACGKPYEQILKTAEQEYADLIVIGVRGRNALDLTLFGSTVNHVIRRASCPVMTLRA